MATPSHEAHRAAGKRGIGCGVITVSDTRTEDTDKSGALIKDALTSTGHVVESYHIVPDEPKELRQLIQALLAKAGIEAVIINGGTGISPRDRTHEVVHEIIDKPLPGFGELFRQLSYEEIGSATMLSRAMAGVAGHKVLFSIPGSSAAVRLAMERLILPELPHIVHESNK